MLLAVNPRDSDAMPLHPFDDMRIAFQTVHHPPLKIALVLLEVPRAFLRVSVLTVYANCHIQ
jgi:hypothetical protein